LTLAFYTQNQIPITTPIDICLQIPGHIGQNDVGMVMYALACGVPLAKALQ
jgi:hypothetical protein